MVPPRVLTLAGALMLFVAATACTRDETSDPPPPSGERPRARTLASMSKDITRDLTPALARERFGAPDVETGSGLIIYKYAVEDGDTLALGFPGYAPITYAQRLGANGTRVQLPLR